MKDLTKQTLATWDTDEHRQEIGSLSEVIEWLVAAASRGLTDLSKAKQIDDTQTIRYWADQETAEAWVTLVTGLAESKGYTVSFTISDVE